MLAGKQTKTLGTKGQDMKASYGTMGLVVAALVVASCGRGPLAPQGKLPGAVQAASVGHDETDLTAGRVRREASVMAALGREAIASRPDGTKLYATQSLKAGRMSLNRAGDEVVVSGQVILPRTKGGTAPGADATVRLQAPGGFGGAQVLAEVATDAQGRWSATLKADRIGKPLDAELELGNARWTISQHRWKLASTTALSGTWDSGVATLVAGSANGEAAFIHESWQRARATYEREGIPLTWWSRKLGTKWPGSGNFYTGGNITLTDAKWWDVNGHEMGHALYFAGLEAASGGGQHKIDECYGTDLALSEGFASFLGAVSWIDRGDTDAKFEYMVPRRAPIRMENVPADVCKTQANEWRVGAALWDVYDTNVDGTDTAALPFKAIWGALVKGSGAGYLADANTVKARLQKAYPDQAQAIAGAFAQAGL